MCDHHPLARVKPRLTARLLCLCLATGLPACGVSTDVYTRTLLERDHLRDRAGQAEAEAAAQRKQAADLRAALTEQEQTNHTLRARITELESQTADQNLTQEALNLQLRSLTAEREELLLRLDESKAPVTGPSDAAGVEADAQQVTGALHDAIEAGHVTLSRLANGLALRLAESFLFVPDKADLTDDGQRLLSTMNAALSTIPPRRLQLRILLPAAVMGGELERARDGRAAAFNRLLALAGQLGGDAESSELVLVTEREGTAPAQGLPATPAQTISTGQIQVLLEWSDGP